MKVKWLGHASFLITSNEGTRIITDPYEPGGFGAALGYGPITEKADIVVVSHDHGDHNFVAGVPGSPEVVRGAGLHRVNGIEFKGVACYHDTSMGRERGNDTISVFSVDGIRICHAGDLGHQPTDQQLAELGRVDVLLLPVGGTYTIDAVEATRLVERLAPAIAIPMHYRTDKCSFPISGVEDFLEGKTSVRRPGTSELEIKKEDLSSRTEIVVLEHAL